jgi:pyruvate ferredoxin oxidoreductase beta subunit
VRVARLATESGFFPVFEAHDGDVTDVHRIRRQVPVSEYLRLQKRFAHLFGDPGHPEVVDRLQRQAERSIAHFGLLGGDES